MRSTTTIVMLGRSRELMKTRTMVLQSAGLRVVEVASSTELARALRITSPSLLIVCHSAWDSDLESALQAAPRLPMLLLERGTSKNGTQTPGVAYTGDGPEKLIASVQRALMERRNGGARPRKVWEAVHNAMPVRWFRHWTGYGYLSRD